MKFLISALTVFSMVFSVTTADAQVFAIDTEKSSLKWEAGKVIGGSHNGEVQFASGKLMLEGGKLSGGSFAANMKSIEVQDLQGQMAEKLAGHLFSNDFFAVEENPSSSFIIDGVTANADGTYVVNGKLTIKGETQAISFPATLSFENEKPVAKAKVEVDRTKFGIRYGSDSFFDNLGDKAIKDVFVLDIMLVGA